MRRWLRSSFACSIYNDFVELTPHSMAFSCHVGFTVNTSTWLENCSLQACGSNKPERTDSRLRCLQIVIKSMLQDREIIYIQSTTLVHWNILTPVRWIATKFTTDTHGPPDFSSSAIIWSNLLFCQILWFLTTYLKYSWNPHQLYFVFTAKYSWHAKPTC